MKRFFTIISFALSFFILANAAFGAATFSRTLQRGSGGDEVRLLQQILKSIAGIYPEAVVSGFFGKLTEVAVQRFQKQQGIIQTGIVGPLTRAKLNIFVVTTQNGSVPDVAAGALSKPIAELAAPVAVSPVDSTPPVLRLVGFGNITRNAAMVSWVTDELADSQVEYGTTQDYGYQSILDTALTMNHVVRLTSLNPGVLYQYRVKSKDARGNLSVSANDSFRPLVTEPSTAAASLCVIKDVDKDIATIGYYDPNTGAGYIKSSKPDFFTITAARQACSATDFDILFESYCLNNTGSARKFIVTYQSPTIIAQSEDACPSCAAMVCKPSSKVIAPIKEFLGSILKLIF